MAKKKEFIEEPAQEEVVIPVVEKTPAVEEVINPYTIGHNTRAFRG
jgi:hypothetical protein